MRKIQSVHLWSMVSCLLTAGFLVGTVTPARAKLAANKLAANKLSAVSALANSAAASQLAAGKLSVEQVGPHSYALNVDGAAGLLATDNGREVLSFIVSCALPETDSLVLPGPVPLEFLGELGLAPEWIDHPLRESGRGWVSACLYARINAHDVPLPISLRGQHPALAADAAEAAEWNLEEGAFYGDFFAPTTDTFAWIACQGADQAAGETGGLVDRDCAEPDPADPTHTLCGLSFAGNCGEFSATHVCKHFSPHDFYRDCRDQPLGAAAPRRFKEIITVYVIGG